MTSDENIPVESHTVVPSGSASPPSTVAKAVHWNMGWLNLVFGAVSLCIIYLFVVDGSFNESLKSSPATAIGYFIAGLLVIPVGALLGIPLWFFGWLIKRRERVSFKPFVLAGMLTLMIIGFAGKQFIAIQTEKSEKQRQQMFDQTQIERAEALRRVELFDTSLFYKENSLQQDGTLYISEIKGRVKNGSNKTLSNLEFKVSVSSAEGVLLDTKVVTLRYFSVAPGDVQSFSEKLYVDRVPKDFTWSYQITDAGLN